MGTVSNGIKKEWRLIVFILGLILFFWLLWILRGVLLPFILGLIFAYMLLPIIRWIEKRLHLISKKHKTRQVLRIVAILIVYILALIIIGLLVFYVINIISDAINTISGNTSRIIPNGLNTIKDWLVSLPFLDSSSAQASIDSYFNQASAELPTLLVNFLSRGIGLVTASLNTIIGYLVLPIFVFFVLKDWEKLREGFYSAQSTRMRKHVKGVIDILLDVVVRYVRGQMLLGLVVGTMAYILLLILGIEYALPLAIFAAATELVPMIGPWIGGGLGVLVTLATAPEKAIWVGLGYIVIQLLENNLLVPRIQGTQMEIHPAFVIVLSVLGAYFAGILGFIIILPATMAIIRLYKYFKKSLSRDLMLDVTLSEEYSTPKE
jgi:predicted PurR-regulated permease PerM